MSIQAGPTASGLALRALKRGEDRIAFRWGERSISYRGCLRLIGQMQKVLAGAGAAHGKCAALLGGNRPEIWCAAIAAQACGMSVSWLHPLGASDSQTDQLVDAGAVMLIVDAVSFGDRGGVLAQASTWQGVTFTLGRASYGRDLVAEAEAAGSTSAVDLAAPEDVATMNYTGGTTGRAKGTVRRHRGVVALTASVLADFEFPREPQFLAAGPISHVTGSNVLPTLIRGGCVRLLAKFDPDEVCRRIDKDRINATLLVPTMIYALLDCESVRTANLGSLGLLLYGASAMSPARLAEGIDRLGPVFAQLYGQTECHPITYLPRRDHDLGDASALGSCGYASTSCDVRLLDDEGQPVEDGSVGEICVRSPACIDGYWNRPQETAEAFKFGWLHTGDLGVRDHRGRFSIVDRKKDMIVTGGFNVYPKEIEDVLTSLSGVAAAAVVGLPDPKWGEAVTAFVVAKPGAELAAPELLEQIRAAKGSMLTPKRIEFVDALPLTPVGKVDKRALRRLPPSLPIASGAIAGSRSERA